MCGGWCHIAQGVAHVRICEHRRVGECGYVSAVFDYLIISAPSSSRCLGIIHPLRSMIGTCRQCHDEPPFLSVLVWMLVAPLPSWVKGAKAKAASASPPSPPRLIISVVAAAVAAAAAAASAASITLLVRLTPPLFAALASAAKQTLTVKSLACN